jgi:hydroxyacylglutathione hydrolase
LTADKVVLATGNFEPAALPHCEPAWENATYENLPEDAPVTLIGMGLTAIDVLLRLRERGHSGTVTAISRHGVFPERHAGYQPLSECVITGAPPETARELLRAVHQALKAGKDWRAVIDSIRPRTNELWSALSLTEKRRFRRHLQRRWEIARHRMAPAIADFLDAELASGSLVIRQGGLSAVEPADDGFAVQYRSGGKMAEAAAARVINCTGPDLNYHRVGSPLLNSLFAQGQIVDGPLGTGLWSDQRGALRKEDGTASSVLFNIGPGRVGVLFESIAVQELRGQAMDLAVFLAAQVSKQSVSPRVPVLAF